MLVVREEVKLGGSRPFIRQFTNRQYRLPGKAGWDMYLHVQACIYPPCEWYCWVSMLIVQVPHVLLLWSLLTSYHSSLAPFSMLIVPKPSLTVHHHCYSITSSSLLLCLHHHCTITTILQLYFHPSPMLHHHLIIITSPPSPLHHCHCHCTSTTTITASLHHH